MHIELEQKLNTKLVGEEWMQKKKKKVKNSMNYACG